MKVGIAGAGIMGRLLAFALCEKGWDISIFDEGSGNNCSMAAAGLLAPVGELEKNDDIIFNLGIEAISEHWPAIIKKLNAPIYFQCKGSLLLSHPQDKHELHQFIQLINSKLSILSCQRKLASSSNKKILSPLMHQDIKNLEPELNKFNQGFYFENEGQIDNQTLLQALENYLLAKKINWYKNTFVKETFTKKIELQDKTHSFDLVIDCRGLGAKKIFNDLRSIRGELIWVQAPSVTISRPIRFLHPRYRLYLVPRPNKIYIIGASEIESHDYSELSLQTALELLTTLHYLHAGFLEARIIKTVTQCRPTLSNHLPKIKYQEGFIAINGLYRHGFLIAPVLMTEVMCWLHNLPLKYPQLWEAYS